MPTRIPTGVGDQPGFLTFYSMIPIVCKITYFSLYLFVCFFKDYFLAHAQLLINGKPLSQYASHSHFLAHYPA